MNEKYQIHQTRNTTRMWPESLINAPSMGSENTSSQRKTFWEIHLGSLPEDKHVTVFS